MSTLPDELTPEEVEELNQKKKLASECASRRRALRDAEKKIEQLSKLCAELSAFLKAYMEGQ